VYQCKIDMLTTISLRLERYIEEVHTLFSLHDSLCELHFVLENAIHINTFDRSQL